MYEITSKLINAVLFDVPTFQHQLRIHALINLLRLNSIIDKCLLRHILGGSERFSAILISESGAIESHDCGVVKYELI